MRRTLAALAFACCAASCASAPPAPISHTPTGPSYEQKLSWILRLEDQRSLHDPAPPVPPPPPVVRGQKPPVVEPPPPPPDLVRLLADDDARVRRRAALAVGRVGLRDGVPPLVARLSDQDAEVREMAAFALGLLGDRRARDPLIAALNDPRLEVRTSAAEALGLIGDDAAADAIAKVASDVVAAGTFAQPVAADEELRRDTPAATFRESLFALTRLKAFPSIATVVLDPAGQPRVSWWPVAYALGRVEDPRALPALAALTKDPQPYTRAFAAKGLGALKNKTATAVVLPLLDAPERTVSIEAVRALGKIGDPAAAPPLLKIVRDPKADAATRSEAVLALGSTGGGGVLDTLLDLVSDKAPLVRAAAFGALAKMDRDTFVIALSSLDSDPDWHVRSALADALATMPRELAAPRLRAMLADSDQRVVPAVLDALAATEGADAVPALLERLKADDPAVRATAAEALGKLKPPPAAAALADEYQFAQRDPEYTVRVSALEALAEYGAAVATPVLTSALADKDWAVRLRAAALLKKFDPASDADVRIRPAPTGQSADFYDSPAFTRPDVSPSLYIDTDRGTIQIELAVLDAPLTIDAISALAQKNFFDGLSFHRVVADFVIQGGDPRGDGTGGPGFSLRDELSERSFLRGTVGIALDGPDTGGSQFFITHSPQPHLDARYTVIGRVVSGMDVVDAIQQGDVIRRVRVWNGNQ